MKKWWLCILFLSLLGNQVGKRLYGQTTLVTKIKAADKITILRNRRSADSLFNLGSKYLDNQSYERALSLFEVSLKSYKLTGDDKKIGDCFNYIAIIHYYWGDYLKTISFFKKSAEAYRKIGYRKGVASILNNIGSVYDGMGNYLKALDYYRQAIILFKEVGEKENLAVTNRNIGLIYIKGKDYTNAIKYFNQSYTLHKNLNDQKRISEVLVSIGNLYTLTGKYNKATEKLTKALQIADEEKDKQLQVPALTSLGDMFYAQADYKKALFYYSKCLAYAKEINSLQFQSESKVAIGNVMQRLGKSKDAIGKCQDGLKLADKLGSLVIKKNGCECLYQAYKSEGNTQQALRYYEQANALGDSLNLTETANRIMNMEFQKQQLVDSIAFVKKENTLQLKHKEEVLQKEKQRNMIIISLCFMLLIAAGLWSQLNFVRKSRTAIKTEKDRSEALLLNILPEEIAEELKQKGHVNARDYNLVSILFTDFKSFTQTAEKMSPQSLVEEINICFKAFDLITEKYQIEKIKTIGDAYMAAGGIPNDDKNALKNSVLAGLEMQEFMKNRFDQNQLLHRPAFEMRLGIHAGPIIAGIVGVKKFQYDVWGDTVNTASRMESSSIVGKVNISETLYQLIKHEACFSFEHRGHVHAKGKGDIAMYFVEKSSVIELVT